MKPALTPEEWASFPNWTKADPGEWVPLYYPSPHGIAAANLHEQPFGFTRHDVEFLRIIHEGMVEENLEMSGFNDIADRIEALLPPTEEPTA